MVERDEAGDPPSHKASEDGTAGGAAQKALGAADLCPFCRAPVAGEAGVRIAANKHRALQAVRTGGRKLFGKARKDVFLQWFGLTASVSFAASQAGVCRQTVSKHRLSDPEFEAAYRQAVELSVPDLQARLHAYLIGRPKLDPHGELEPPDDAAFDPQLALQILREQHRMMSEAERSTGAALKRGRMPRVATNAEVRAALAKALKAFAERRKANPPRAGEDR